MTDRVNPSQQRAAESFLTAGAIAGAGGSDGYVLPNAESPSRQAIVDAIDETQFNEFAESSSSTSLTVTIDGGEAYIYGAWLGRDEPTTLTLDANQNNQVIYLGWDHTQDDTVIIGFSSQFSTTDPKIPLYSYDTDADGVTSVSIEKQVGTDVVDEDQLSVAVSDHSDETTDVHGVTSGAVESTDGSQQKVDTHSNETTGVHGVGTSDVASTSYVDTSVSDHSSQSSNVHGVGASAVASTSYVDTSVSDHAAQSSNVHNVSGDVAGTDYVDTSVSNHASQTGGTHGVPSTTEIASLVQVSQEISSHNNNDVHNTNQPPQSHDNSAHSVDYLAVANRYTNSEAVSAADSEVDNAATTLAGLDDAVDQNSDDITNLQSNQISTSDVSSRNWADYEIQKNGTDGQGIINFKTQ